MPASAATIPARSASQPGPTVNLLRVLHDVTSQRSDGELVVRSGDGTGRVFVVKGRIAWAFVAEAHPQFTARLIDGGLVAREDVEVVIAECRQSGGNFCETLVAWGLVDREPLRSLLRAYVAEGLARIVGWSAPQALFVPQERAFASDFTFSLEELVAPPRGTGADVRPAPVAPSPALVSQLLADAMGIDGAIAAALVDHEQGGTLGRAGGDGAFDVEVAATGILEVVRAKVRVTTLLGAVDGVEDLVITLSSQYHLVRVLRHHPGLFLYVALDRAGANLALARYRLAQLESTLAT